LSPAEVDQVVENFQNSIAIAPTDLFLKPIPQKESVRMGGMAGY
jgi:hypothetical protein